jgi:hypothetical protein
VEVDVKWEVEDVVLVVFEDYFHGFDVAFEEVEGILTAKIFLFDVFGEGACLEDFLVDITIM